MTGATGATGADNLAAALERRAAEGGWTHDVAFVVGGRSFTHGDVHDGAARAAGVLARRGVGRGDRVLVVLSDGIELVWSFLGAVRLGAVAVLANPRLTPADHDFLAADARPRVVVCDDDLAGRFAGAEVVPGAGLERLAASCPPEAPVPVGGGAAAYAQYTSGTTGTPRAAVHAHGHPAVYFDAFARPALAIDRGDVVLSVSKLYFAYGLGNALFFPLFAGCRAVLVPGRPRPDLVADLVEANGVSLLFAVPTFYAHLVAPGRSGAMGSLRAAVSAGERLAPPLAERAGDLLGCPVLDGLGSTEVGQTFASNTLTSSRPGTVGRALPPYRVSVRDDGGEPLPAGRVGSLWVAGPTLLLEYLGRPDATRASRRGEWLVTGDRAEMSDDGFVRLHGRSDDLEMVGGISVSPVEIEAVLGGHPAVTEVAVAAVARPDGSSRLTAFVVRRDDAPAGDVSAELLAVARSALAPFKVPRGIRFVDALPRTPTGKLRRFVLREGEWPPGAGAAPQPSTRSPKRST